MTWELFALVAIQVLILAAAWGDMRRQVSSNRERQDERHLENRGMLKDIAADVKRINGTVAEHRTTIKNHEDEIDRLRRKR